jgi:predicted PurR-regulated permease PerM
VLVVLVLGHILLQAVVTQGTLLMPCAPEFALHVQAWYEGISRRFALLEQLDLFDLVGGASGLSQWAVSALRQVLSAASPLLALFGGAINVIFVLFMALDLTVDGPAMRDYLLVFLPLGHRPQARRIITNISLGSAARLSRMPHQGLPD